MKEYREKQKLLTTCKTSCKTNSKTNVRQADKEEDKEREIEKFVIEDYYDGRLWYVGNLRMCKLWIIDRRGKYGL